MEIFEFMKMFSSKTKLKLLKHFYTCHCEASCVNDLVNKFGSSQANISKHLTQMLRAGVVNYKDEHKTKYYSLNSDFKKEHQPLLKEMLSKKELDKSSCKCGKA